jgi:hypothetical protein
MDDIVEKKKIGSIPSQLMRLGFGMLAPILGQANLA